MTRSSTPRSTKSGAGRARTGRNAKAPPRSKANAKRKGKSSAGASGKRSAPAVVAGPSLSRIYVRTGLVVAALVAFNVYYFRGESDLIDRLIPRSASMSKDQELGFGQVPKGVCEQKPASMLSQMSSLIPLDATLQGKASIESTLGRLGLSDDSIEEIRSALEEVIDPSLLEDRGYPLRLRLDPDLRLHGLELELESGHLVQLCREGNKLRARNLQLRPSTKTAMLSLRLDETASLASALKTSGERIELAHRLGELLGWELDPLADLRPSDRIDLIVEKQFVGDTFHRYGKVLAFAFQGAAGKFRYFFRTTQSGKRAYYDAAGRPMQRRYLKSPTPWYWASAGGGRARPAEQVLRERRRGAEYRRPQGLPVFAVTDLTITQTGKNPHTGAFVESVDQDGRLLRWSGLASPLPRLSRGDEISQGQPLGFIGPALGERVPRLRLELRDKDGAWVYLPDFLSRGSEADAAARVGETLGPAAQAAHSRAILPWIKRLSQASRS